MSFFDRQDRMLLLGLALALIVVFARPIRYLLDLARDVENSFGLALVPALIILTGVFLFHQQGKRQEAKAQAAAAEATAQQAEARAAELERLLNFGQALGRSLDTETIRDVVLHHLPKLTGTDDAWVLVRTAGRWEALAGTLHETRREVERAREHLADRVLSSQASQTSWSAGAIVDDGQICLPLAAGGHLVGVMGISEDAFAEAKRRTVAMSAALLAICIRNAQLFSEVRDNSLRDGLTGCFNRTHAIEVIDTELRRARRSQLPVSLIMFDLDHFKDINDQHGHLCGDAVLAVIGARMRDLLRGSDLKCRYGGEEFLVLLPETALEGAKRVADTLRRELAETAIQWQDATIGITASFGVTTALPSEVDSQALIARADAALYRAKDQGRNCVRLSIESAVA
jgi:diguanylate cyclase (GGDEF)-like protein